MTTVKIAALLTMCLATAFLAASSFMADEAGPVSPTGASVPEGRIVHVAADGSGDFNCDGKDDHVEISQAIEYVATHAGFSTVHLKGPATYWVSDTIFMHDNTILEGDSSAALKLIDHCGWPKWQGIIECKNSPQPTRNITIRGFEIDGNSGNNRDLDEKTGKTRGAGAGYYCLLLLFNAYDVTINDMYLHDMLNDGISFFHHGAYDHDNSKWIQIPNEHVNARVNSRFYNNRIIGCGHDGIYIMAAKQFEVYNNYFYSNRVNSAIRPAGCSEYSVHHNKIHNEATRGYSGNAGLEIQNLSIPVDNVEIYENEIYRMGMGGIVLWNTGARFGSQKNIHIHHNRIHDCNLAGIRLSAVQNTLIENNVLYGNRGDGIVHYFAYGPAFRNPAKHPEGSRYTTIVRNNIIANTLADPGPDSIWGKLACLTPLSGYGLNNYLSDTHAFVSEHNCICQSAEGDYNHASSTTDIHVDPLFADPEKGDFHLLPDSPCRGAGTDGKNIGAYE